MAFAQISAGCGACWRCGPAPAGEAAGDSRAGQQNPSPAPPPIWRRAMPPGQWTRQARDYANTRYSPLTQINKANVGKLRIAWSFQRRADVRP